MSVTFDTYCGLSCTQCEFKEKMNCPGCIASQGHPFHGACEVAECAKSKGRRFCGECGDFPCEILTRYSNDPEHGDTPAGARVERCREIKTALVAEAREGIDPVSVCGHHCNYCWMGQWCGGCRSSYNCCSYATISESGVCPNVKCAGERGFFGCWQCPELDACEKGYYTNKNEYVAKATALFIRAHGEATYTRSLKAAIDAGLDYPKSFDATGSVSGALALLEEHLQG